MDPHPSRVRIITYNTHHGAGVDGRLDLERIARVIEAADPDVVLLQELDRRLGRRSDWVDQPAWYAQRLGMEGFFAPTLGRDHPRMRREAGAQREPGEYGLGIFVRASGTGGTGGAGSAAGRVVEAGAPALGAGLRNTASTPLPNHPGGEPRVLAQADATIGGRTVRLYCTHLTQHSIAGRNSQVDAIREAIAPHTGPAILAGDFNTFPRARAAASMRRVMRDAWFTAETIGGERCSGVPILGRLRGYTMSAPRPTRRIDYVYVSPGVRVREAWLFADGEALYASDHLPVAVTVDLPVA